jgi:hypothetical protein
VTCYVIVDNGLIPGEGRNIYFSHYVRPRSWLFCYLMDTRTSFPTLSRCLMKQMTPFIYCLGEVPSTKGSLPEIGPPKVSANFELRNCFDRIKYIVFPITCSTAGAGSGLIALLSPNLETSRGGWSTSHPGCLTPGRTLVPTCTTETARRSNMESDTGHIGVRADLVS